MGIMKKTQTLSIQVKRTTYPLVGIVSWLILLVACQAGVQNQQPSQATPIGTTSSVSIEHLTPEGQPVITSAPPLLTPVSPLPSATTPGTPTVSPSTDIPPKPGPTTAPTSQPSWEITALGDFLLYGDEVGGERYIYAFLGDGTSQFVSYGDLLGGQPWSPDGRQLVFANGKRSFDYPPGEIAIADLETGTVSEIRLEGKPEEVYWSPDGNHLLYPVSTEPPGWNARLALYNIHTQQTTYLTDPARILWVAGWSLDGRKIAYVSDIGGHYDLYTLEIPSLNVRQLTNDITIEYEAHWSPTADLILFGTLTGDHPPEITPFGVDQLYLIDASGVDLVPVTEDVAVYFMPRWSPDGRRIVSASQLCILDLEHNEEDCLAANQPDYYFSTIELPDWSADGSMLGFRAALQDDLCQKVYIIDIKSREVTAVGEEGCNTSPVYWSRSAP